jgi:hypothetical protein
MAHSLSHGFPGPWIIALLWFSPSEGSRIGVSSNCECLYSLKVDVAENRLEAKDTLYVVAEQIVVTHVKVP